MHLVTLHFGNAAYPSGAGCFAWQMLYENHDIFPDYFPLSSSNDGCSKTPRSVQTPGIIHNEIESLPASECMRRLSSKTNTRATNDTEADKYRCRASYAFDPCRLARTFPLYFQAAFPSKTWM